MSLDKECLMKININNLELTKKIDVNKYYLVNWNKYLNMNNKKLKDFYNYLKDDNKFIFVDDTNENIKSFIWKNKNEKLILIFPIYSSDKKKSSDIKDFLNFLNKKIREEIELLKFINTIDNLKIKILWSLEDIYNGIKERNILNKHLYSSNFINLLGGPHKFIFENYILNSSEQQDIKIENRNQLIKRYNYFSSFYSYYNIYNNNPENNIILSGKINSQYPERLKLLNLKNQNVVLLKYDFNYRFKNKTDEYVKLLSKFLCGFVSGATNPIYKFGIVHKIYEVLSAGCLLLCPESHENLLTKIGLVKNVNYMCINFVNNPNKTINFICNEKNREFINNIRKKGHELAKNVFNAENKYKEFLNIIENI